MIDAGYIQNAITGACPVVGVSVGDPSDKETWTVHYAAEATDQQKKSAEAIIAALDVNAATPWKVSTYTIVRRLEVAGLIDAADAALASNKTLFRRFYTVGYINSDADDAVSFLKSIGANPTTILAVE